MLGLKLNHVSKRGPRLVLLGAGAPAGSGIDYERVRYLYQGPLLLTWIKFNPGMDK